MCFRKRIKTSETTDLKSQFKVAKRNIPMFKVVFVENVPHDDVSVAQIKSLYYDKNYELGKEEIVPINTILDGVSCESFLSGITCFYLTNGLHSYSPRKVNIDVRTYFSCYRYMIIGNKMYDFETISLHQGSYAVAIMRCVIPKGALYIYNERGEYVSNSLIPVKIEFIDNK